LVLGAIASVQKAREPKQLKATGNLKLHFPHSKLLVGKVGVQVILLPLLIPSVGTHKEMVRRQGESSWKRKTGPKQTAHKQNHPSSSHTVQTQFPGKGYWTIWKHPGLGGPLI
jgi:hypothetical protein